MEWLQAIEELKLPSLRPGKHPDASRGLCAMEMVAFMERLEHSDRPSCTCPVIAGFVRRINDSMNDKDRQRLLPYLPRLVGTVAPELEQQRAEYLVWQACHVFAPIALRRAGMDKEADALASTTSFEDARLAADRAAQATILIKLPILDHLYFVTKAARRAAMEAAGAARWAVGSIAGYGREYAASASGGAWSLLLIGATTDQVVLALAALDGVLEIGTHTGFTAPERVFDLVTERD